MKAFILPFVIIIILLACNKKTTEPVPELQPCELLATGIYNDTLPGKVPTKFWPCMGTNDLVDAISYNFPSLYMFMAGCCGLQSGYDLCRKKYSWFVELEGRTDALEHLIAKYISIDTVHYNLEPDPIDFGGFKWYTYNLEVFMAQEVYLKNATDKQRLALLDELFVKQKIRKGKTGWGGNEGPTFVMARLMYYYNYEPFMVSVNQNYQIKLLVDLGHLYTISDSDEGKQAQLLIFAVAYNFIDELKTHLK